MKDYSRSKIYKIVCNVSGLVYVGSTCEPTLARRLAKHVGNYKVWLKNNNYSYTTSYKILEGNDYDIVLIEEVQCETKDQLHARERYHIENLVCVNRYKPTRTSNEYKKEYAEEIKVKNKIYSEKHKEEIKINSKLYYEKNQIICICECGKNYKKAQKYHHNKTKYHQNFLKSQNEISDDNLPCSLDGLELESN
jgi:hypothetical protein